VWIQLQKRKASNVTHFHLMITTKNIRAIRRRSSSHFQHIQRLIWIILLLQMSTGVKKNTTSIIPCFSRKKHWNRGRQEIICKLPANWTTEDKKRAVFSPISPKKNIPSSFQDPGVCWRTNNCSARKARQSYPVRWWFCRRKNVTCTSDARGNPKN
jgi:hypothetical protein